MRLSHLTLLAEYTATELRDRVWTVAKEQGEVKFNRRDEDGFLILSAQGEARGQQGADDHIIAQLLKVIQKKLGDDYKVEKTYAAGDDEKPTGFNLLTLGAKPYVALRVKLKKKALKRSRLDGDVNAEHAKIKIAASKSKAGEKNEHVFVRYMSDAIKEAKKVDVIFDGVDNDVQVTLKDVVECTWVGHQNEKPDVELLTEDGEIIKLSLKMRDFFEIDVGSGFIKAHQDEIYKRLEDAVDSGQVELDDDEKFSKDKHFELAMKLSAEDADAAYFGEGENVVDAVLIETFLKEDFKLEGTTLKVHCDYVLRSANDLHKRLWPYASLNSDFDRSKSSAKPILGQIFLSVVPQFKLNTHPRRSSGTPKTLIL